MAKRLNTTVHLRNDETGKMEAFGPGDEVPDWAVGQLDESWGDRPDLWGDEEDEPSYRERVERDDLVAGPLHEPAVEPLSDDEQARQELVSERKAEAAERDQAAYESGTPEPAAPTEPLTKSDAAQERAQAQREAQGEGGQAQAQGRRSSGRASGDKGE